MSSRHFLPAALCAVLCACVPAAAQDAPPALPKVDYDVVLNFRETTDQARKAWQPMTGTAPVSVVDLPGGGRAVRMPCNLAKTTIERASWDRAVKLDLTNRRGIQFLMHCTNARPVGHFSLYLRSGGGWYTASFSAPTGAAWKLVTIEKAHTRIEGSPAGWGQVDLIRISAWRGRDEDTEFHLAALGLLGKPVDAKIVIIRADSAIGRGNEARTVTDCTQRVARMLEGLGLACLILSDRDVTAERLKDKRVAILPHNPGTGGEVAEELVRFVQGGGKVLACYSMPSSVARAIGIDLGRHVRRTYDGQFASIRPAGDSLAGLPPQTLQASWNIQAAKPLDGRARVAAVWYDQTGKSTGLPAIVVSDRGALLTHIPLADDPANKPRMLLAMVGHLWPEAWPEAAKGALARVGRFGEYTDFAAAIRDLRARAEGNAPAAEALARLQGLHERARGLRAKGDHAAALVAAGEADRLARRAFYLVQKPQPGEHRAFWCHSAFGVAGMSWDQAAANLADHGFTAVLPNMLWGGVAYYRSDVLPVSPAVEEKGDQIALCAAACKKHALACHVWKVNFNLGWAVPKAFVEKLRKEGRLQVDITGKPIQPRDWLCPSHPANRKLEIDSMVEVARKYDVAGLHFDYIRYPHQNACYCAGCRERFEKSLGRPVAHWPGDLRKDRTLWRAWMTFRQEQITAVVAGVAERARKVRPGIQISAAVFRNWPVDRDGVGQDWKLWCEKGYLDFVCPMDYTPDNDTFARMVADQLEWAGKVPCYPGIGASVWPDSTDTIKLIQQITITRRLKTGGFTIFNYGPAEAATLVPQCGLGITRPALPAK